MAISFTFSGPLFFQLLLIAAVIAISARSAWMKYVVNFIFQSN